MSWYPKATKRPIPEANSQPDIKPRGICLHTAVSNSKSLFGFWTSPGSDGVESHFYLQKEGTAEQYVGTETRADCQVDGNPYCISVECWDGAGVVWTRDADIPGYNSAQIAWLVEFLAWAHLEHGIPLRLMRYMGDSGIGYHRQFIGPRPSFATKPRACPGNRKVAQIPGIIALANKRVAELKNPPKPPPPLEDEVTPQDRADIAAAVLTGLKAWFASDDGKELLYDAVLGHEFAEYEASETGMDGTSIRVKRTVGDLIARAEAQSRRAEEILQGEREPKNQLPDPDPAQR